MKIFMLFIFATVVLLWLMMLIMPYYAFKNLRYKSVWICLFTFFINVVSFAIMVKTILFSETISCIAGVFFVLSTFFYLWYVWLRKSFDFLYIKGYTADDLERLISPEFKKMLHIN